MCVYECVLTCPNRARATRAPRAHTENSRYHTQPNGQLSKLRGKRDGGLGDGAGGRRSIWARQPDRQVLCE